MFVRYLIFFAVAVGSTCTELNCQICLRILLYGFELTTLIGRRLKRAIENFVALM